MGTLISQDNVEVKVDLEKMLSRHLAILAMTGAGKSDTVAIVVDGILEYNGCVVIFTWILNIILILIMVKLRLSILN